MATPVGHYLLGLSIAQLFAKNRERKQCAFLAACACFPDFDVLPGILVGELGKYHHGASHSFAAAVVFATVGLLSYGHCSSLSSIALSGLLFLLYSSHVLLDYASLDTGPPVGVPLLWPWDDTTYQSPWLLLPNVYHTVTPLVSLHNAFLVLREAAIFTPLVALTRRYQGSDYVWKQEKLWIYGAWFVLALWASVLSMA
jgi:membrane-bound metal-dependent hydrolase YbcI (DUF457 family)